MYMDSIKKIKAKSVKAAADAITFAKENKAFMFKLGLMAAVVAVPDVGFCNSASNIQVTPLQKPVQMFTDLMTGPIPACFTDSLCPGLPYDEFLSHAETGMFTLGDQCSSGLRCMDLQQAVDPPQRAFQRQKICVQTRISPARQTNCHFTHFDYAVDQRWDFTKCPGL